MTIYLKDPASSVDYSLDWSSWLAAGEAITSTSWSIDPSGASSPALGVETEAGATRSVFIAGGAPGHRYRLTCRIRTDGGRTVERSLIIRIAER